MLRNRPGDAGETKREEKQESPSVEVGETWERGFGSVRKESLR